MVSAVIRPNPSACAWYSGSTASCVVVGRARSCRAMLHALATRFRWRERHALGSPGRARGVQDASRSRFRRAARRRGAAPPVRGDFVDRAHERAVADRELRDQLARREAATCPRVVERSTSSRCSGAVGLSGTTRGAEPHDRQHQHRDVEPVRRQHGDPVSGRTPRRPCSDRRPPRRDRRARRRSGCPRRVRPVEGERRRRRLPVQLASSDGTSSIRLMRGLLGWMNAYSYET